MEIEVQRWAPLSASSVQPAPGGFGWSQPVGGSVDDLETIDGWFLFDADYKPEDATLAGAFFARNVTQFASEPDAWKAASGSYDDIASWSDDIFVQESGEGPRPGRIIDIDIDNNGTFNVIFVPNYDQFYRPWWWYRGVAHASTIKKLLNGEAVGDIPTGPKKRLVTITEDPNTHHMAFVLEERKKGDSFWWGVGFHYDDIVNNIAKGNASSDYPSVFPQDNIPKRLVLLEGHRKFKTEYQTYTIPGHSEPNPNYDPSKGYDPSDPNSQPPEIWVPTRTYTQKVTYPVAPVFLFIMAPNKEGLKWKSFPQQGWQTISSYATKNKMRVISIHPFDKDPNLFSAVLVQNSS